MKSASSTETTKVLSDVGRLSADLSEIRASLREAIAWGLHLRHKKDCDWYRPASNFQKNQPCKCGLDALRTRLNKAAFRE